ncbi:MAG: PD40 domain-containing protein [Acidobacteriota bacterium]|nr:MAG: PD40 domain-containing protein [Acidobacteriota bacterium]
MKISGNDSGGGIRLAVLAAAAWLTIAPAFGQLVHQVTDFKTAVSGPGSLDDAGTWVFAGASADPLGVNPDHAFQVLRFDAATGNPVALTSTEDGTSPLVSVSDDGQWIAFSSLSDPTGQNHDQSVELFVARGDGSDIAQLTDDPRVNAGTVSLLMIAGGGARVAFVANTDPLGTNPDQREELFVTDRDGTNLRQLTTATSGSIGALSISDDGARIAFEHTGDLTGANPDQGSEIFSINADGTGLVQLTSSAVPYESSSPSLSGNGQRLAFQSDADLTGGNAVHQDEIFVIDWGGTGLRQLTTTQVALGITGDPASQFPSITDDGETIVYHSNHGTFFSNLDGNFEIFRIRADGSARTALTNTFLTAGSVLPVVSGGGGRIAYYGIDDEVRLRVMDGDGNGDRALLTFQLILNGQPDLTADGTRIVFVQTTSLLGGGQVWRVEADGSDVTQVTNLGSGSPGGVSIAADRQTIVFSADSNPAGASNSDLSEEIFVIHADGTGLTQLTSGPSGTSSEHPVIADDGSVIVFDSDADLTGTNADGSREIFRVDADGANLQQLTSAPAGPSSRLPRVDATGSWVAFESSADLDGGNPDGSFEIYRMRIDGTGLERLTGDPSIASRGPDISGDGQRVAFRSSADPLGQNPELNSEIFVYDAASSSLVQLTSTTTGSSSGARLSGDGQWVFFSSDAPFFEQDPDDPADVYRVPAAGGDVARVGALRLGALGGLGPVSLGGSAGLAVSDDATRAVFGGIGNFTDHNRDLLSELWLADRNAQPDLAVSRESPTVLSWVPESGPLRYDAVRGDVAALGQGPGETVDLGAVICLEDDSPDSDTTGFGDPPDPVPGQAFFFVYRGSQGLDDGPGRYGPSSDGLERQPASGDCTP